MLPSCKRVAELVAQSQDEKLSLRDRIGIKLHIMICKGCQQYAKQLNLLNQATQTLIKRKDGSGEGLSDEAKNRIEAALKETENKSGK